MTRYSNSQTIRSVIVILFFTAVTTLSCALENHIHRDGSDGGSGLETQKVEVTGARLTQYDYSRLSPSYGTVTSPEPFGNTDAPSEAARPKSENNSKKECGESTPNPVLIATGEKWKDESDFSSTGLYGLSQTRTYRSKNASGRLFGTNWASTYDYPKLKFTMTGCYQDPDSGLCYPWQVMLSFPDGTTYRYTQGNILQTYTVSGAASTGTLYYMPTRWTLRLSDKTYNYSKAGYLQSIRNNFGDGSLNFTYSSTDPSKLVRVTNGVGQRVEYVWTGDRVTQVTDPAGRIWRYSYDSNGMLMKASSPGAAPDIRTYHYESTAGNFLLTGISINGSRYSTYKYFPDGRVQESGLTGGEEVNAFEYGPFQTVVRDAFGQATTYSFVSIGGELRVSWVSRALTTTCGAAAAETRYDANGYIATTFDWKRLRSDFNYDALGRLTFQSGASVSPRGSSIGYTWDGVYIIEKRWLDDNYIVYAKVNYNYFAGITSDVKGRLSSEVWTDVRTSAQRTTNYRYSYHPSQAIASIVVAVAIPGGTAVTTTSYDTQGNVVSVINPLGQQTTSAN